MDYELFWMRLDKGMVEPGGIEPNIAFLIDLKIISEIICLYLCIFNENNLV